MAAEAGRLGSSAAALASTGRGKGPGGPPAYPELTGEAGLAGGEASSEQFEAAAVRTCGGNGGGYSDNHGPIPAAGKKRRARRSFPASQRSSGWLLAAAGDGGHGGKLGY
jgi:hypothetical protein